MIANRPEVSSTHASCFCCQVDASWQNYSLIAERVVCAVKADKTQNTAVQVTVKKTASQEK